MFSLKHNDNIQNNFNSNNIIYSTNESRPSKSLINCENYKKFSKINLNISILDEFSYLNSINKSKKNYLLVDIVNNFKLKNIDFRSFTISFDSIIVNEIINDKNLIICFDKDISIKNVVINLQNILKEINENDDLILSFSELFTYPSSELLYTLSKIFKKIKVYNCKLIKQNIIYCKFYKSNNVINIFIKNILKNWSKNTYVRQFGIFIDEEIQNKIKKFNNMIFEYYINLNNNFTNSSIEEKEFFFKNYIKKHSTNNLNSINCSHEIKEYNLFDCYICCKCYELFKIY